MDIQAFEDWVEGEDGKTAASYQGFSKWRNESYTAEFSGDGWNEFHWFLDGAPEEGVDTPFGKVSLVEQFGGEGQGDDYWIVISVDGTLYKKYGYHASHDGSYLDGDLVQVEAYTEPVTKYRRV